jgi:hypothetical protein
VAGVSKVLSQGSLSTVEILTVIVFYVTEHIFIVAVKIMARCVGSMVYDIS